MSGTNYSELSKDSQWNNLLVKLEWTLLKQQIRSQILVASSNDRLFLTQSPGSVGKGYIPGSDSEIQEFSLWFIYVPVSRAQGHCGKRGCHLITWTIIYLQSPWAKPIEWTQANWTETGKYGIWWAISLSYMDVSSLFWPLSTDPVAPWHCHLSSYATLIVWIRGLGMKLGSPGSPGALFSLFRTGPVWSSQQPWQASAGREKPF
jgi:hypothetical protein